MTCVAETTLYFLSSHLNFFYLHTINNTAVLRWLWHCNGDQFENWLECSTFLALIKLDMRIKRIHDMCIDFTINSISERKCIDVKAMVKFIMGRQHA